MSPWLQDIALAWRRLCRCPEDRGCLARVSSRVEIRVAPVSGQGFNTGGGTAGACPVRVGPSVLGLFPRDAMRPTRQWAGSGAGATSCWRTGSLQRLWRGRWEGRLGRLGVAQPLAGRQTFDHVRLRACALPLRADGGGRHGGGVSQSK